MAADVPCCGTKFSVYEVLIIGFMCFAGIMVGLTLGLMSLGIVDLEVLIKSGRPQDIKHACNFCWFSLSTPNSQLYRQPHSVTWKEVSIGALRETGDATLSLLIFTSLHRGEVFTMTSENKHFDGEKVSPTLLSADNVTDLFDFVDVFLFDCHGVIWRGDTLLDGVPETLEMLRSKEVSEGGYEAVDGGENMHEESMCNESDDCSNVETVYANSGSTGNHKMGCREFPVADYLLFDQPLWVNPWRSFFFGVIRLVHCPRITKFLSLVVLEEREDTHEEMIV